MATRDRIEQITSTGVQRRTIIGAAAWAAPAIAVSAASPALATSSTLGAIVFEQYPTLIRVGQEVAVIARLVPGIQSTVSIALSPAGGLTAPTSVQTAADGSFSFLLGASAAGSPVTVVLSVPGYTSEDFSVSRLAGGVGTIELTSTPGDIRRGEKGTVTGRLVTSAGVTRPSTVSLGSSATSIATVPASAAVAADGTFTFPVTAVAASGQATISINATNHSAATFVARVTAAVVTLGTIAFTSTPGDIPQGDRKNASGKVTPPAGGSLPSALTVTSSATGVATVPATVAVASDGTFSIPVTAVAASGTSTITASATGYTSKSFVARATSVNGARYAYTLTAPGAQYTRTQRTDTLEVFAHPAGLVVTKDESTVGFQGHFVDTLNGNATVDGAHPYTWTVGDPSRYYFSSSSTAGAKSGSGVTTAGGALRGITVGGTTYLPLVYGRADAPRGSGNGWIEFAFPTLGRTVRFEFPYSL